jgi:hypothetical protein
MNAIMKSVVRAREFSRAQTMGTTIITLLSSVDGSL